MSDLLAHRLKNSEGRRIRLFLINGFKFEGKIVDCDDTYLVIDEPNRGERMVRISDIKGYDIYGNEDEGKKDD